MPLTDVAPLEATTEIAAPPAKVWALVSDLRHMSRWSPQNIKTFVRGGEMKVGARLVNVNRRGLLVWPTQGQVVDLTPEKRVAFRIKENWTVWSFDLEPTADGGTRLTQRREAPKGISDLSVTLTKRVLGGQESFTAELQQGMQRTLERIKADAER